MSEGGSHFINRRSLLLSAASVAAAPSFGSSRSEILHNALQPGPTENFSVSTPTEAAQRLAESSFTLRKDPSLTSQNRLQIRQPGQGPAIPHWPHPGETRQIWLQRPQAGEELVARYFDHGKLNMDEYLKVCRIMRDVRGKVAAYIDVEVLDLVFAIQKWLVAWGIDKPVIVQSGYRSLATNMNTEGAAKNSLHLQGQALDIRMPGVPTVYLGRLASIFQVGGVGFYVNQQFIHTDTGRVRYWGSRQS